jgi:hypothetical protein
MASNDNRQMVDESHSVPPAHAGGLPSGPAEQIVGAAHVKGCEDRGHDK